MVPVAEMDSVGARRCATDAAASVRSFPRECVVLAGDVSAPYGLAHHDVPSDWPHHILPVVGVSFTGVGLSTLVRLGNQTGVAKVIVGNDAHKKTHTLVAIDGAGRALGERTVPATTEGHHRALRWVRKTFGTQVRWAVEDVRSLTARLERDLPSAD